MDWRLKALIAETFDKAPLGNLMYYVSQDLIATTATLEHIPMSILKPILKECWFFVTWYGSIGGINRLNPYLARDLID
jgi:hypothetical protein